MSVQQVTSPTFNFKFNHAPEVGMSPGAITSDSLTNTCIYKYAVNNSIRLIQDKQGQHHGSFINPKSTPDCQPCTSYIFEGAVSNGLSYIKSYINEDGADAYLDVK